MQPALGFRGLPVSTSASLDSEFRAFKGIYFCQLFREGLVKRLGPEIFP